MNLGTNPRVYELLNRGVLLNREEAAERCGAGCLALGVVRHDARDHLREVLELPLKAALGRGAAPAGTTTTATPDAADVPVATLN